MMPSNNLFNNDSSGNSLPDNNSANSINPSSKKRIAILGSTGSVGTKALEVIRENPARFGVSVLTAQSNVDLLVSQALEFKPARVVIADAQKYPQLKDALAGSGITVLG